MGIIRTSCNPAQLKWAREEAGLSIEQAALALDISTNALLSAEQGEHFLTLNQLREASKKFNYPYGYFYLKELPKVKKHRPVPDFRVDPNFQHKEHYQLNLILKKIRDRRETYEDLITPLGYEVKRFKVLGGNHTNLGSQIRARLNVSELDIAKLTYDNAYAYWKAKIENDGVLVYESDRIPDETGVIGAALFYESFPIILIKRGANFNERKLFTLLHEYSHLLYGESGINDSDSITVEFGQTDISSIESKCNLLAAEILVPTEKINKSLYQELSSSEMMEQMARQFKITFSTAAVCLRKNKMISQSDFIELMKQRRDEYQRKSSQRKSPAIPREHLMRLDLGRPMFRAVIDSYSNGYLNAFDASGLLGLRVKKVDSLLKEKL